jgi:hypothetical protein
MPKAAAGRARSGGTTGVSDGSTRCTASAITGRAASPATFATVSVAFTRLPLRTPT